MGVHDLPCNPCRGACARARDAAPPLLAPPHACRPRSNACFGFDKTTGWTFFDLSSMHDSLKGSDGTVLEADFYHADQLLPQSDEELVAKVQPGGSCPWILCSRCVGGGAV